MSDSQDTLTVSKEFYLDTIIFKVETTLYKVPKAYFVEHSAIFRDMFSLPQVDSEAEGTTIEKPLVLEGVKAEDFNALLALIFPKPSFQLGVSPPGQDMTMDNLDSVLKLCRKWMFLDIHRFLIKVVDERDKHAYLPSAAPGNPEMFRDTLQKILMGREHRVSRWIESGYSELVQEGLPLADCRLETVGWKQSCQILQLRDRLREQHGSDPSDFYIYSVRNQYGVTESKIARRGGTPSRWVDSVSKAQVAAEIKETFAEELQEADRDNESFYQSTL